MSPARQYELVYIVSPDATDQDVADLHAQIETIVARYQGEMIEDRHLGAPEAGVRDRPAPRGHLRPRGDQGHRGADQGTGSPPEGHRQRHPPPDRPRGRGSASRRADAGATGSRGAAPDRAGAARRRPATPDRRGWGGGRAERAGGGVVMAEERRGRGTSGPKGRGNARGGEKGAPRRGMFRRRKVCKFCADKIDDIDYKDVKLLSRSCPSAARSCRGASPAPAPCTSASCRRPSCGPGSSRCCPYSTD